METAVKLLSSAYLAAQSAGEEEAGAIDCCCFVVVVSFRLIYDWGGRVSKQLETVYYNSSTTHTDTTKVFFGCVVRHLNSFAFWSKGDILNLFYDYEDLLF
jgi:hypothetical protein